MLPSSIATSRQHPIHIVFAEGGCTANWWAGAKEMFGYHVEIVKRNEQHPFLALPERWVVGGTFAWLAWFPAPETFRARRSSPA